MTIDTAIPLASLLGVAFLAGLHVAELRAVRAAIKEIRAEHDRSAASQGDRIGAAEKEVGTLMDFKARTEARIDAERDFSGRVR